MAIITLPAKFGFTKVQNFGLIRQNNVLRSRFTGQAQRVIYSFALWEFRGTLVEYDGAEAADIRAFLTQLQGIQNSFRLPVPGYSKPRSGITVNGTAGAAAAARASSMTITVVGVINKGDFFTVQDELKIVTSVAGSTIGFQPPLRKAVASGVAITFQNPWCLMYAAEDDVAKWSLTAPVRHGLELEAIEAVDI